MEKLTLTGLILLAIFVTLLRVGFIFVVWNYLLVGGFIPEITLLQAFALGLLIPAPGSGVGK